MQKLPDIPVYDWSATADTSPRLITRHVPSIIVCYDCMGFGVLSMVFLEAVPVLSGRRVWGFRFGLLAILIPCLCVLII